MECHIPRLYQIPKGKWRCCECSAVLYKKRQRCGECKDCIRPDCGKCSACKCRRKFGGDGKNVKPCKDRDCKNMRLAAPESINPACAKAVKRILQGNKNSTSKSIDKSISNSVSLDCPFLPSSQPIPRDGLNSGEFKIVRLKPSNKKSFFREMFPGKIIRVVSSLNDDKIPKRTLIQVNHFRLMKKKESLTPHLTHFSVGLSS